MKRRICVVTGSRAEYGLLRWLMDGIRESSDLELQVIATGMHLSPEFGLTFREIESDGFVIDEKVEMLLGSDTPVAIAKSMGLGLIGFADAYDRLRPDLLVVLGDRFEILSATSAALVARIAVAHLHGGETTEGAFDESIRHAITKMSHLHFVAAEEYRRRVIQLGEHPDTVHMVGGLGVDNIKRFSVPPRAEVEAALGFSLGQRNLLVTFHPETLGDQRPAEQLRELLAALQRLEDTHLVFTMPNADTDGRELFGLINEFANGRANTKAYTSLGQDRYLGCIPYMDGVVGNSSSGLTEVPSFGKGTINIGNRQQGRLKASSVIDCKPLRQDISAAIAKLYSAKFQASLQHVRNPYGDGGAVDRIVDVIRKCRLDTAPKKSFFDIDFRQGKS
ncbi:MAG: UDP-N-acetylglucosamine 2-epimerase (hydrolyzing) [Gammaproteobacteria bacterium]|nr:UDP-N-acetylglucosamine 2-epimerase (hydrolyzing) [Gammaproteobacteria bacterium]